MRLISVVILSLIFFSCKKKEDDPIPVDEVLSNGMVVLCEGLFQQNNSSVSWIGLSNGTISFMCLKFFHILGSAPRTIPQNNNSNNNNARPTANMLPCWAHFHDPGTHAKVIWKQCHITSALIHVALRIASMCIS